MTREKTAFDYLKNNKERWVSPTEIGGLFGGHSAIGSPICKKLVLCGHAERNDNGHYKFKERSK